MKKSFKTELLTRTLHKERVRRSLKKASGSGGPFLRHFRLYYKTIYGRLKAQTASVTPQRRQVVYYPFCTTVLLLHKRLVKRRAADLKSFSNLKATHLVVEV